MIGSSLMPQHLAPCEVGMPVTAYPLHPVWEGGCVWCMCSHGLSQIEYADVAAAPRELYVSPL